MKETFIIGGKEVRAQKKYLYSPLYRLMVCRKFGHLFVSLLCLVSILCLYPASLLMQLIMNVGNAAQEPVSQWKMKL